MCCSTRTDVCYPIVPVGRLSVAQAQFVKRWFLSLPDLTWCVFGVTTPSASAICNCESVVAAAFYVCIGAVDGWALGAWWTIPLATTSCKC